MNAQENLMLSANQMEKLALEIDENIDQTNVNNQKGDTYRKLRI